MANAYDYRFLLNRLIPASSCRRDHHFAKHAVMQSKYALGRALKHLSARPSCIVLPGRLVVAEA